MGLIDKLFGKKPRVFKLKPNEIKEIIPNKGGCLATDKITYDGMKVGYMYREEANNDMDNGWRFFSGTESQDYVDDANNTKVYDMNTIANYDQAIIAYIDFPVGSELERIPNTDEFKNVENSRLKNDEGKEDYIEILMKSSSMLSDKGVKVSLYKNLSEEVPDEILMIDEVISVSGKDEAWDNVREYLEGYSVYPIAEVLGGSLIVVGYSRANKGIIYYHSFDFGLFELDKSYDEFTKKLIDAKIPFYD